MGTAFQTVLSQYSKEGRPLNRPLLLLALTDGEANDKDLFNSVLDEIQDGLHGDVQVLLMGLSLEPEDIAWFEDEECDDTRIRTIEAYEVEQQLILFRKVIRRQTDYNFDMHVYRALVTNFFPADYDYEAPLQTLRHRLYITLHALDRRFTGNRDAQYSGDHDAQYSGESSGDGGGAGGVGGLGGMMCCAAGLLNHNMLCCAGGVALFFSAVLCSQQQERQQQQWRPAAPGSEEIWQPAAPGSEGEISDQDSGVIGELVERLQADAMRGRQPMPLCGNGGYGGGYGGGGYGGGYGGRYGVNRDILRQIQTAIGALSPTEQSMRDYQFMDIVYNKEALQTAISRLRSAARQARYNK